MHQSLFNILGIPEGVSIPLTLIFFSLSLSTFLSNLDFGVLKIPEVNPAIKKKIRIIAPTLFFISILFFLPVFPAHKEDSNKAETSFSYLTEDTYLENFNSDANFKPLRKLTKINNTDRLTAVKEFFKNTKWKGSDHWGIIQFDTTGRVGTYSNTNWKSPGKVLIQTSTGTVPAVFGEWFQGDNQFGKCIIVLSSEETTDSSIMFFWGPQLTVKEKWVLLNKRGTTANKSIANSGAGR